MLMTTISLLLSLATIVPPPVDDTFAPITEDSVLFNCATMGNHICGDDDILQMKLWSEFETFSA